MLPARVKKYIGTKKLKNGNLGVGFIFYHSSIINIMEPFQMSDKHEMTGMSMPATVLRAQGRKIANKFRQQQAEREANSMAEVRKVSPFALCLI